jgi:hypothetical protein
MPSRINDSVIASIILYRAAIAFFDSNATSALALHTAAFAPEVLIIKLCKLRCATRLQHLLPAMPKIL